MSFGELEGVADERQRAGTGGQAGVGYIVRCKAEEEVEDGDEDDEPCARGKKGGDGGDGGRGGHLICRVVTLVVRAWAARRVIRRAD